MWIMIGLIVVDYMNNQREREKRDRFIKKIGDRIANIMINQVGNQS